MLQLFRESMSTPYENILALDTEEVFQVTEDYFSARKEAVETAGEQATKELDARTQLFLFELSITTPAGGGNKPFVTIEWPGIQIPQKIISNLLDNS